MHNLFTYANDIISVDNATTGTCAAFANIIYLQDSLELFLILFWSRRYAWLQCICLGANVLENIEALNYKNSASSFIES